MVSRTRPGLSGISGAQLRTIVRCLASPRAPDAFTAATIWVANCSIDICRSGAPLWRATTGVLRANAERAAHCDADRADHARHPATAEDKGRLKWAVATAPDLPVGSPRKNPVKHVRQKYFCFTELRIMVIVHPSRLGMRGVSRSSRHARRDAVDALATRAILRVDERR